MEAEARRPPRHREGRGPEPHPQAAGRQRDRPGPGHRTPGSRLPCSPPLRGGLPSPPSCLRPGRADCRCPQSWTSRTCAWGQPRARSWTGCGPATLPSSRSSCSASPTGPLSPSSRWARDPAPRPRAGPGGPPRGAAGSEPSPSRALLTGEVGLRRPPAGAPAHPRLRERAAASLGLEGEQRRPQFRPPHV